MSLPASELAKEPAARRPYSYEGNPQWDIDVNNIGITRVRERERTMEQALVEHEALGPLGIRDLLEVGDLSHPEHCHGCWAMWAAEAHPDWQHDLSCDLRPCGDVDSHLLVSDETKADLIFDGMIGGLMVGLLVGLVLGVILTLLAGRIW